jgi:hypothetical protein
VLGNSEAVTVLLNKAPTTCAAADMDGFKLLEIVGLELGLPVISAYPQLARTAQL